MDRERPDIVDADPPGRRDTAGEAENDEPSARALDAALLLTDAALRPDDPVEGEFARRGADPDLGIEPERGEEEP